MALLLKALAFAGILTLPATVAVAEKAPCVMASSEERAEMIDEINAQRARAGLSQLKENRELTIAAQQHACDMQWSNFFGHVGSNGSDIMQRTKSAKYDTCLAAENIAYGPYTIKSVADALYNSPGHQANILNPRMLEVGFGYQPEPDRQWAQFVQVFGLSCRDRG